MTGVYIQCDTCPATIDGVEVTPPMQGFLPLSKFDGPKLRKIAAERGWTSGRPVEEGPMRDWCPKCSGKLL